MTLHDPGADWLTGAGDRWRAFLSYSYVSTYECLRFVYLQEIPPFHPSDYFGVAWESQKVVVDM